MGLSDSERDTLVQLYLSKSDETWEDAVINRNEKRWNNTANRLYYALYHALTALFLHDGITIGSHKGVKIVFGRQYVITGKASEEDAHLLSKMESMRNRADYDCTFVATEDIINERFPQVEAMIARIKHLIQNK